MTDQLRALLGRLPRANLLAAVRGLAVGILGLTNPILLVLMLLSLLMIPVFGVGFAMFPVTATILRWRVDLSRRLATWSGVPIERPYLPIPPKAPLGSWRRFRHVVRDPGTWRDFAWLVPGGILAIAAGLLAFFIPLYGLEGTLGVPFWLYLTLDWYGYGLFWPMTNFFEALACVPQGLFILAVGLAGARWLVWLEARFAKLFLSPTKAAALALRVEHLTTTRTKAVDARAAELRRIERDLHDGAQARLVAVSMSIGLAEELLKRDPAAAATLLAEARQSSGQALAELRDLVRGIHPPVLAERGLEGAVRALALTLPLPVEVNTDVPGRAPSPVESAAYFVVAEALTNVVKHSGARHARIDLRHVEGRLIIEVVDDGAGGATIGAAGGLRGIEERLGSFDGTMRVSSPPGGPTTVTMELPCELSSPRTSHSSETG